MSSASVGHDDSVVCDRMSSRVKYIGAAIAAAAVALVCVHLLAHRKRRNAATVESGPLRDETLTDQASKAGRTAATAVNTSQVVSNDRPAPRLLRPGV